MDDGFVHFGEHFGFEDATSRFEPSLTPPPRDLIRAVGVVAFADSHVVLVHSPVGLAFAGGRLQAGEAWPATVQRELWDQAGARLLAFPHVIGSWRCEHTGAPASDHADDFRTEFLHLMTWAEVELVDAATSPGQNSAAALPLAPRDAVALLHEHGQRASADLVRLACRCRSNSCSGPRRRNATAA